MYTCVYLCSFELERLHNKNNIKYTINKLTPLWQMTFTISAQNWVSRFWTISVRVVHRLHGKYCKVLTYTIQAQWLCFPLDSTQWFSELPWCSHTQWCCSAAEMHPQALNTIWLLKLHLRLHLFLSIGTCQNNAFQLWWTQWKPSTLLHSTKRISYKERKGKDLYYLVRLKLYREIVKC